MGKKICMVRRSGFTLIEIMVVVVILGLLAALVVPRIGSQVDEAKNTAAKTQIDNFINSLEEYKMHNGFYPSTQQGLDALLKAPTTPPVPKFYRDGGYLSKKKLPDDPWGNPYIYRNKNGRIEVISTGPDGKEGGEGNDADISSND